MFAGWILVVEVVLLLIEGVGSLRIIEGLVRRIRISRIRISVRIFLSLRRFAFWNYVF